MTSVPVKDNDSVHSPSSWRSSLSQTLAQRPRRVMAAVIVSFFVLAATCWTQENPASRTLAFRSGPTAKKYAVVNFVDETDDYLWGVYSTHKQLRKVGMTPTVKHIAMVSSAMSASSKALLTEWLGPDQVWEFHRDVLLDKVHDSLRQGVFLKTLAFNLTEFDKVIAIDNDVMVRQNLMHWYKYPSPAATGARGMIEWNSGAMVIEPSKDMFNLLLEYLPKVRRWTTNARKRGDWDYDANEEDTWTSNGGHQGFLSAFFLSNVTNDTIYTMDYGCSVLSSDLDDRPHNAYYWKYRQHVFETVHFTRHKPWKPSSFTDNPVTCALLREWVESVADAPRDRLPKLPNFMRDCPDVESEEEDVEGEEDSNDESNEDKEEEGKEGENDKEEKDKGNTGSVPA